MCRALVGMMRLLLQQMQEHMHRIWRGEDELPCSLNVLCTQQTLQHEMSRYIQEWTVTILCCVLNVAVSLLCG